MQVREKFVKKHVHRWKLVRVTPETGRYGIERQCEDCNKYQYGYITISEREALPASLVHLADVPWYDGILPMLRIEVPGYTF